MKHFLAFDLGASSGRAIIGTLDAGKLSLKEVHRFANGPVQKGNSIYWDFPRLVNELKEAAEHCKLEHCSIDGFWVNRYEFCLSVAWFHDGKLHHSTRHFDANDKIYEFPTIVERRSKWEKN